MKVTFPHMGTMYIGMKTLLTELGLEVVIPPLISQKTLELGVKNSPEFACLPLKLNIGNYIQALEAGADTILMGGGVGPCRFGYYCEVQKDILNDLGYEFDMIVLEPFQGDWKEVFRSLIFLAGNISIFKIKKAWQRGWTKIKALDQIARLTNNIRPYLIKKNEVNELYTWGIKGIDEAVTVEEIRRITKKFTREIYSLKIDKDFRPLKVGLVGEIYILLEPFSNVHIEEKLGNLGVLVDKSMYLSKWIQEDLYFNFLKDDSKRRKVIEAAKPYLNSFVGGHGRESIGETVLYAKNNFDGVVHLGPFTCMPEIIAQSILPTISRDFSMPVLSLTLDEHTGEAGYITRLEAFIDLLERKDKKKKVII